MESAIEDLKKENRMLRARGADCKHYSWRWALKLHGLEEEANKDIRKKLWLILLEKLLPVFRNILRRGWHCPSTWPKKMGWIPQVDFYAICSPSSPRWCVENVKGCQYLREHNLRFTEALSPEDNDAREKLWPPLKKAREEGKKSFLPWPLCSDWRKTIDHMDI